MPFWTKFCWQSLRVATLVDDANLWFCRAWRYDIWIYLIVCYGMANVYIGMFRVFEWLSQWSCVQRTLDRGYGDTENGNNWIHILKPLNVLNPQHSVPPSNNWRRPFHHTQWQLHRVNFPIPSPWVLRPAVSKATLHLCNVSLPTCCQVLFGFSSLCLSSFHFGIFMFISVLSLRFSVRRQSPKQLLFHPHPPGSCLAPP